MKAVLRFLKIELHKTGRNIFEFFFCYSKQTHYILPYFALHILGEANELRIGWGSSGEMTIRVEGERTSFSLCCGDTMEDFVFGWHKHCFTYKTNEYTKVCNIVYYRLQ